MESQTANDECGICLEELTATVTLPCSHKFCADCLDGWKSKFGDYRKEERSKSCPLCRKKIPPSKDLLVQLRTYRKHKLNLEARGETTSETYLTIVRHVKRLEAEVSDYEGKGLDYDYDECVVLPKYIYDAIKDSVYVYKKTKEVPASRISISSIVHCMPDVIIVYRAIVET